MSNIKVWIFLFIEALWEFQNQIYFVKAIQGIYSCPAECICLSQTQV